VGSITTTTSGVTVSSGLATLVVSPSAGTEPATVAIRPPGKTLVLQPQAR
jgi:hypothetical protein